MAVVPKSNILKKRLIKALISSLGIVTQACEVAKCSRKTFYQYCREDENFQKAVEDIKEIAFDFVESKIYKQIKDDNTAMIIFFAKTKMKHRGYIERTELSGPDGSELKTQVYILPDGTKLEF